MDLAKQFQNLIDSISQSNLRNYLSTLQASNITKSGPSVSKLSHEDIYGWTLLGGCLTTLGRFDDADSAYHLALELDNCAIEPYFGLAGINRLDQSSITRLTSVSEDERNPKKKIANFTLGHLYDRQQDYDKAFHYFKLANEAQRNSDENVEDLIKDQVDELVLQWSPETVLSMRGWGNQSDVPVFIVGMPRSGTTLVEQIIASHSNVFGCGERTDVYNVVKAIGMNPEKWNQTTIRQYAMSQLSKLKLAGRAASRVTDKMPDNVFRLGLIAILFPHAKIIVCHRDKRDIGLSCYFQNFGTAMFWSNDLRMISDRITQTERIIKHWHSVLPLPILDVNYETLISNPEAESKKLISFIGLDWEEACLRFHETQRQVLTASTWQVRQPLNDHSIGRWKHYEKYLAGINW